MLCRYCRIPLEVYAHIEYLPSTGSSDFVFPLRSITLAAGATQQRLVVQLTNDVIVEDTETFSVRISVFDEDTRVQPDTTTVFIEDDDSEHTMYST